MSCLQLVRHLGLGLGGVDLDVVAGLLRVEVSLGSGGGRETERLDSMSANTAWSD